MSSVSDIEKNLRNAEDQLDLFNDNERITQQQLQALHQKLNQVNDSEDQEMQRIRQPFEQADTKFAAQQKEFERARDKFTQAEAEFRKLQEKFTQTEAEHNAGRNKARQTTDTVVKKFMAERARIEREIEAKEREQREMAARRTNASRDVALLRRRYDDARQKEMAELRRNTANSNHAPSQSRYGTYR